MIDGRKLYKQYEKYMGEEIILTLKDGRVWECECVGFTGPGDDDGGAGLDVARGLTWYLIYLHEIADIKLKEKNA